MAAILKIENRPYLRNGLTDLREIWYDDAHWTSERDRKFKFPTFFDNPRWRTFQIFNGWDAQEGRTASACQILAKLLKTRLRYGDFSIFQDGGRPRP